MRESKDEEISQTVAQVVKQTTAPARITVRLPADARLYVDNVVCPLTSGTRSFNTPALEPGRDFYYTLRAEVVRDGRTRRETQRVIVSSGREVSVAFRSFDPVATASR